ncbi:MAG TPA: glycosyltransferase 87 family protein [Pseudonocardiaceae bacterium]|jgi:hypothetical protein|nr:glycosyltransferase 87 family protein [Pseudonocardiaceae bacterium]
MRQTDVPRRTLALDAGFYLLSAAFAGVSALFSQFYGYRIWGALAVFGYLAGLLQALVLLADRANRANLAGPDESTTVAARLDRLLRSRNTPIGLITLLGLVMPLIVLIIRRLQGVPWAEQPEVWTIERSATLLLRHGTPYTDFATLGRPPVAADYTPYGVAMSVFGIPHALFGLSALTDARIAFAVVSVLIVAIALRVLGWPSVPTRTRQLVLACPLTALTFAVAGDDLPIVALLLLALALLHRRRPVLCGGVIAIAVSIKLTASPALIVLAVAVLGMLGRRALLRFTVAVLGAGAVLTVPVLLVDPHDFVEQVVKFPLGLGIARSPAASPLPGVLIGELGPAGHATAIGLMLAAALAIGCWLVLRPPRLASDAAMRSAIGLGAAIMLSPATRYGYLVYPIALFGAALALREWEKPRAEPVGEPDTSAVSDTRAVPDASAMPDASVSLSAASAVPDRSSLSR